MEAPNQEIVIVGAGIAGLSTALGLHRLGLGSLVLESSEGLRVTGFGLGIWTNAWRALDALGIADNIRKHHLLLRGLQVSSSVSGVSTFDVSFEASGNSGNHEVRCVQRKFLLEALVDELPRGTVRYSSKVVSIEESNHFKLVHLANGSIIKSKVLIGCDGVNSVVSKLLGLPKPVNVGRAAVRALVEFSDGHGFGPTFLQYIGDGVRHGFIPVDKNTIYWFFTFFSTIQDTEIIANNPSLLKEMAIRQLRNVPPKVRKAVEDTKVENICCSPLKLRLPWQLLLGNICKGNACVAGDALHPMTPDMGQGGCAALEDGVVLARCLGEALLANGTTGEDEDEDARKVEKGLAKFGKERRWRSIELIVGAYLAGFIQQAGGKIMVFLRDKILSRYVGVSMLKMADFDCGKLHSWN